MHSFLNSKLSHYSVSQSKMVIYIYLSFFAHYSFSHLILSGNLIRSLVRIWFCTYMYINVFIWLLFINIFFKDEYSRLTDTFPWHFESIIPLSSDFVAFEKSVLSLIVIALEIIPYFCLAPFQTFSNFLPQCISLLLIQLYLSLSHLDLL